ncbi:MAG: hypothetical protein K6G18_05160 [Treponema sp.]|nr:hypothetical protein [Treponema sp.]
MPKPQSFLPILTVSFLFLSALISPLITACNGNGGTSDQESILYNTPSSRTENTSGNSPDASSSADDGKQYTAQDIVDLSNTDNTESIVAIFMGGGTGDSTAQTDTVTLNADDIGLPAGGTATLTIQGSGINYTMAATADANGTITYEIPAIATGSEITVTLTVKAADGTMLYTGSNTKTVSGGQFQMDIQLARQFWTLPASIRGKASPAVIAYKISSADSDSVLFSAEGLEDAPEGAVFSYSWKDASGAELGTGATLTRTVSELLGGAIPTGDITKTFTVTVSYTDASGSTVTSSGSASATVGGPAPLPDFKITMTAPSAFETRASGENTVYLVPDSDMTSTDVTKLFRFTAELKNASDSWPDGVTYTWSFLPSSPQTATTIDASASVLTSLTAAPINETAVTVTCTAKVGTILTKDAESSVTVRLKAGLPLASLSAYLDSLTAGSASAPHVLPAITGLTPGDIGTLRTLVRTKNTFVDLSNTTLPSGTNMTTAFFHDDSTPINRLIRAPKLPADVTTLVRTFGYATNLVEAPEIPAGVTNMASCFQWCYALTSVPEIPDGVTNLSACFDMGNHATALSGPPVIRIPASVENMFKCFNRCTSLQNVDIIIEGTSVTNWQYAFNYITSAQNVTVWVPNDDVKNAILDPANGNDGVTVNIGTGP